MKRLDWRIMTFTSWHFFEIYYAAVDPQITESVVYALSSYLLELAVCSPLALLYLPSVLALSSISVALSSQKLPGWTAELEQISRTRYSNCTQCVLDLLALYRSGSHRSFNVVRNKYSRASTYFVASLPVPPLNYVLSEQHEIDQMLRAHNAGA